MSTSDPDVPCFSNIRIVLVEPEAPGNIGAVTRAMMNFGFHELWLVNPCDHTSPQAYWMSVHARDILDRAHIVSSLQEALKNVHLSVGTTNRKRITHNPSYTPKEIAEKIPAVSKDNTIALVFGREHSGLTNEELHQCSLLSTIPAHPSNVSLNLAQAVIVYLYEMYQSHLKGNPNFEWRMTDPVELEYLYQRIERVLNRVGFVPHDTMEQFIIRIRRVLGRTPLETRDARLFHRVFKQIEDYLKNDHAAK
jgi:TrmH family RNA methyltransferase